MIGVEHYLWLLIMPLPGVKDPFQGQWLSEMPVEGPAMQFVFQPRMLAALHHGSW